MLDGEMRVEVDGKIYSHVRVKDFFSFPIRFIPCRQKINPDISCVCFLLKSSAMTVFEISDECGFNSLRTMNRNFFAETGMPPAEYRRQHEDRAVENPMS